MIRKILVAAAILASAPAFAETVAPATAPKVTTTVVAPIDVNAATIEQLAGVKGLSRTLAEAIVKGRPYKTLGDLTANKVLPESVFAEVKNQLTITR